MRSRTFRQGSVGLLAIGSALLLLGGIIWLKRIQFSVSSYTIQVNFQNANGLREGGSVFYRGFEVGKIKGVQTSANGIEVTVEINQPQLRIPQNTIMEANQGGLIGETSLDLVPQEEMSSSGLSMNPLDENDCDSDVIVCNGDRFQGKVGSSFNELVRSATALSEIYSEPIFADNVNETLKNTALATQEIANLSAELANLSKSVRQEIGIISSTANVFAQVAKETAGDFSSTANQLSQMTQEYRQTAKELNELIQNTNALVNENREVLVSTLNNISSTSGELRVLIAELNSSLEPGQINALVDNLETLTTNAAEASGNLKEVSTRLNDSTNLVMLQQTLDAARVTFANTQKITSDLDELTGDPEFRNNLLRLVNGLSNLVSSTEQLETQIQVVQSLENQQEQLIIAQEQQAGLNEKITDPQFFQLPLSEPSAMTITPLPIFPEEDSSTP